MTRSLQQYWETHTAFTKVYWFCCGNNPKRLVVQIGWSAAIHLRTQTPCGCQLWSCMQCSNCCSNLISTNHQHAPILAQLGVWQSITVSWAPSNWPRAHHKDCPNKFLEIYDSSCTLTPLAGTISWLLEYFGLCLRKKHCTHASSTKWMHRIRTY